MFIYIASKYGLIEPIVKFFTDILIWLFTLNATQSNVSIAGEIFVKIATFAVSYSAVGSIFRTIGWFNSEIMKISYFVISTIVSFALCYVVMLLETHLVAITVIMAVTLLSAIVYCGISSRQNEKKVY